MTRARAHIRVRARPRANFSTKHSSMDRGRALIRIRV
jgi:hypothetical protein